MGVTGQADFGGGIFRSPRAPRGSVYDCVDGLVDDELAIYRRGGGVYKSNAGLAGPVRGLQAASAFAGSRVLFWDATTLKVLDPVDDVTPLTLGLPLPALWSRVVAVGGFLAYRESATAKVVLYGGSLKAADYSTGTVSVTSGSKTVTGVGTAFLANVDKGMIFTVPGGKDALVESVTDNTHLELREGSSITAGGSAYTLVRYLSALPVGTSFTAAVPLQALGTAAGRLLIGTANRVYFRSAGDISLIDPSNYHELPFNSQVVGIEGVGDDALVFTTAGVWQIGNMAFDLTDADGNPQQTLHQISKDVVAWSDSGIVGLSLYSGLLGWRGQVVVPALDDVYMLGSGGDPVPLSRGIRPLYRSYVAAGYMPGAAALFRGHYFLPILALNGTTVADVLVCRLDQRDSRGALRPAWTRLGGFAAGGGFAGRFRPGVAPDLLSVESATNRVTDLTGIFSPAAGNKNDVDGTTHNLDVTFNDLEPGQRATLQRVRVHAEIVDAASDNPTLAASYAVDAAEGAALTALSGVMSEGTDSPKTWRVVKRGRRFRLRLLSSGPAARLRVRLVEWFVRDSNRP